MTLVWFNGDVLPASEARVPALDRGVLWGYGLFETMRAYGGRVFALADHLARLRTGAEVLAMPLPAIDFDGAIAEVLRANGLADAGVRITITRGAGPADPAAEADGEPNAIVTCWPVADYTQLYESGVALVTFPGGGRPLAGLKTTSYASSIVGRIAARRAGADDAVFVGDEGRVLEATGSNVFTVAGRRLVTTPIEESILPGVTRAHVMRVASDVGLVAVEEPLDVDDLLRADEVLLTSSLREVYPARSVDGRELGRGPVCARLRDAYRAAVAAAIS